jgi:hypothetical protein
MRGLSLVDVEGQKVDKIRKDWFQSNADTKIHPDRGEDHRECRSSSVHLEAVSSP